MKKNNNSGFMLAEVLIVTTFVAGVLIFLFIQFLNLSNSYDNYYVYNSTESLYALEDIIDYIKSDSKIMDYIEENMDLGHVNITDCSLYSNVEYCSKLFEILNIDELIFYQNSNIPNIDDEKLLSIMNNLYNSEDQYNLIAKFKNFEYATLRFVENKGR